MRNSIVFIISILMLALSGCSCGKRKDLSSETSSSLASSTSFILTTSSISSQLSEESTFLVLRDSKPSDQIVNEMAVAGWQSSSAQASELGIFKDQSPVAIFTAKNNNGSILLLSWFDSIEAAQQAYDSLLPSDSNCLHKENG